MPSNRQYLATLRATHLPTNVQAACLPDLLPTTLREWHRALHLQLDEVTGLYLTRHEPRVGFHFELVVGKIYMYLLYLHEDPTQESQPGRVFVVDGHPCECNTLFTTLLREAAYDVSVLLFKIKLRALIE